MKPNRDGRYRTSFRYDGKVYTIAGKTEAEVHRKAGRKKAELEAGKIKPAKITVRQYSAEWLAAYHKGDKSYQSVLENQIIPELGDLYMKDVTEAALQGFLNRKAEKYSKSYVAKMKLTLCQLFRKARKNHLIPDDPAEDLALPECKQGKRRSLTDEEKTLLLRVTENHRGKLFVRMMLYCGLRPQEAAVLQWKHIYDGAVHIRQARKRQTGEIGPPKSKAGVRDIPIPDVLQLEPGAPDDYVCSWDGKPINQKKEATMWANILREMDIAAGAKLERNRITKSAIADDLDLYCLRHTYCTDLQKAGVPINIARELMGHEDISVTAQIYTHTGSDETKKAVEKLSAHLAPAPQGTGNVIYAKFG